MVRSALREPTIWGRGEGPSQSRSKGCVLSCTLTQSPGRRVGEVRKSRFMVTEAFHGRVIQE